MVMVVVRDGRHMRDADPAAVWALVADPARIEQWAPVRQIGYLGTELPGVGHVFFLAFRPSTSEDRARRFRIAEWDAGHRFRCDVEGSRLLGSERVDVIVTSEVEEGRPGTNFEIRYRADAPPWVAPVLRVIVGRVLRRAVENVQRLLE